MSSPLRIGLIAPKNTPAEQEWLLSFLKDAQGEIYRRGGQSDLVWFVNVTEELRWLKKQTDTKTVVICMEPKVKYPKNYDPSLLQFADVYSGYRNFAGEAYQGTFLPFVFPAYPRGYMREEFPISMTTKRDAPFCIMATHDPNIRSQLATVARKHGCIAAGPLFGQRFDNKLSIQHRAKFELITENDINDYYVSEKISASLLAGCVPVYHGGKNVSSLVPEDMFVNMRDFWDTKCVPDVEAVIAHCMKPGVYEHYAAVIRERALGLLLERFSIEGCLIEPVQKYIDQMNEHDVRAKCVSMAWRVWRARLLVRGLLGVGNRRRPL